MIKTISLGNTEEELHSIPEFLNAVAQLKSFIAWIREAIKAKDRLIKEAKNLTDEERVEIQRLKDQEKKERYINRVKEVTDGYVKVCAYTGSKKDAAYHCILCGYGWTSRSDRIFSRNYCPNCRKSQKK